MDPTHVPPQTSLPRVICVTSGKGGVGKTNVAVNLGVSLSKQGKKVLLLDADLGLANIDVLLGLKPQYTLHDVLSGERSIQEIIIDGPDNLSIIPASSGIEIMGNLSHVQQATLIQAVSDLDLQIDYLIVDTAAGIAKDVMAFASASQDVLVVMADEPASLADAYALIKVMSKSHGIRRFNVLCNMVSNELAGRALFDRLVSTTDKFLQVSLTHLGSVPADDYLRKAVRNRSAVVSVYPNCSASKCFRRHAESIDNWKHQDLSGGIQFFFERFLQVEN
jgi:flagellar biosynthesis protein FlhG